MVIKEILRDEFHSLVTGPTRADCLLKLEDGATGHAVERYRLIVFESEWRSENIFKQFSYARAVLDAYLDFKTDKPLHLIAIHWKGAPAVTPTEFNYGLFVFRPELKFPLNTDREELMASLRAKAMDPSGSQASTMDIVNALGLILNSKTDFGLYKECLNIVLNMVPMMEDARRRFLELIFVFANEFLTTVQEAELKKSTAELKSFYAEALEIGERKGLRLGLEKAALGLMKAGDSVERLRTILGLPAERLRELEAQARSQGEFDPKAS
ncbi:MAG: hypothetical protein LBR53_01900 [Deltaproteobacteria bacterium]|jgi:hypothetical protein|nr:hypothetical protein [Deltaproteobacteria bacterium]